MTIDYVISIILVLGNCRIKVLQHRFLRVIGGAMLYIAIANPAFHKHIDNTEAIYIAQIIHREEAGRKTMVFL